VTEKTGASPGVEIPDIGRSGSSRGAKIRIMPVKKSGILHAPKVATVMVASSACVLATPSRRERHTTTTVTTFAAPSKSTVLPMAGASTDVTGCGTRRRSPTGREHVAQVDQVLPRTLNGSIQELDQLVSGGGIM